MCDLDKYKLTKQLYFKCHETPLTNEPTPSFMHITPKVEFELNLINYHLKTANKLVFLLIENDNLFPTWSRSTTVQQQQSEHSPHGDMVNFVDYKRLIEREDEEPTELDDVLSRPNRTRAQIFALVQPTLNRTSVDTKNTLIAKRQSQLNLTLEIKMPPKFHAILSLVEADLRNRSRETNVNVTRPSRKITPSPVYTNLFDQIFASRGEDEDASAEASGEELSSFIEDGEKLRSFKKTLFRKWLSAENYDIVYGTVATNTNLKYIEWSTGTSSFKKKLSLSYIKTCSISSMESNYKFNMSNEYGLFARLNCVLVDGTNNAAPVWTIHKNFK